MFKFHVHSSMRLAAFQGLHILVGHAIAVCIGDARLSPDRFHVTVAVGQSFARESSLHEYPRVPCLYADVYALSEIGLVLIDSHARHPHSNKSRGLSARDMYSCVLSLSWMNRQIVRTCPLSIKSIHLKWFWELRGRGGTCIGSRSGGTLLT